LGGFLRVRVRVRVRVRGVRMVLFTPKVVCAKRTEAKLTNALR